MASSIVCDSSSLISFSDTCNIDVLRFLKQKGARFFVPPGVNFEIIKNPLHIRRYQFSAVRLKKILDDGVLELASPESLLQKTADFLDASNNLFFARDKFLPLVQQGEAECVAAYREVGAKALLVDEKTTRLLIENPVRLYEILQEEYAGKIRMNDENLKRIRDITRGMSVVRSCDVLAAASRRGFFDGFQDKALAVNAAIYSLKESGCGLSNQELEQYEKMKL